MSLFGEEKNNGKAYQQQLINKYEAELERNKIELERLRMVEEECIYLRKQALDHYRKCKCCDKKNY